MTELDKKIQKAQTDLVQSVLEAQEKRNQERVDMLINNAIKQLKMSRFKPDQTTCLSLAHLARICPKIFSQSVAIKDTLKSLLRRDSGPANLKVKNDIVLPILCANILLACCDAPEIRTTILNKIEQWLVTNHKGSEMIQQLLATLCMKCQSDQQTISSLVDMRYHWLSFLVDDSSIYYDNSVPSSLCVSIRKLLTGEINCESLVVYLKFLVKYDSDIEGLSKDVSKFIIERPMSLSSMQRENEFGPQLNQMILRVFIKLLTHLKASPANHNIGASTTKLTNEPTSAKPKSDETNNNPPDRVSMINVKEEKPTVDTEHEKGVKSEQSKPREFKFGDDLTSTKSASEPTSNLTTTVQLVSATTSNRNIEEDINTQELRIIPSLYVRLPNFPRVITLSRPIVEAILLLLASSHNDEDANGLANGDAANSSAPREKLWKEESEELLNFWLVPLKNSGKSAIAKIYADNGLTEAYNPSDRLRQVLVHSPNELLVEFGMRGASVGQLLKLLQQFGTSTPTLDKLLFMLEQIKDVEQIRCEVKDISYLSQLVELYSDMGVPRAKDLFKRLELGSLS